MVFPFVKSLVVDGIIAELSLVPRIHTVVVSADPPSCPMTCVLSNNSQKRKKETFTVSSWFYSCATHTLFKSWLSNVSAPFSAHIFTLPEGSLFRFSSGNIARFVVSALVYLLLGLWS